MLPFSPTAIHVNVNFLLRKQKTPREGQIYINTCRISCGIFFPNSRHLSVLKQCQSWREPPLLNLSFTTQLTVFWLVGWWNILDTGMRRPTYLSSSLAIHWSHAGLQIRGFEREDSELIRVVIRNSNLRGNYLQKLYFHMYNTGHRFWRECIVGR